MFNNYELFTELTPEDGATLSGGQGNSGTPVNLKLPDSYLPTQSSINYSPPPPPKESKPPVDVDKDCKCIFPPGGNVGVFGTTSPLGGGIVIRF